MKGLSTADSGMVEKEVSSYGIHYGSFGKGGDILLVSSGELGHTLSSGFTCSGVWSIRKSI